MNSEFYSSPEFLNAVACVTVFVLSIALIIGLHPFKSRKRLVVVRLEEETTMWTAGDYFMFLNSLIRASKNVEELQETMVHIERYYDKAFRVPISTRDRKEYYARLLESYCEMESKFEMIPVELCKN
jgi:hypothetical protein